MMLSLPMARNAILSGETSEEIFRGSFWASYYQWRTKGDGRNFFNSQPKIQDCFRKFRSLRKGRNPAKRGALEGEIRFSDPEERFCHTAR